MLREEVFVVVQAPPTPVVAPPDGCVADPLLGPVLVLDGEHVPHEREVAVDVDHRVGRTQVGRVRAARGTLVGVPDERLVERVPQCRVGRDARVDRRAIACEERRVDRRDLGPDLLRVVGQRFTCRLPNIPYCTCAPTVQR